MDFEDKYTTTNRHTPVPRKQKCSFDGSDNSVVELSGKIIQTRFDDEAARDAQACGSSSWYQWKNSDQQAKGWFCGSRNKPKSPNPPEAPTSAAMGSNRLERVELG
eukprot:1358139-Amphidinium_carterae.1